MSFTFLHWWPAALTGILFMLLRTAETKAGRVIFWIAIAVAVVTQVWYFNLNLYRFNPYINPEEFSDFTLFASFVISLLTMIFISWRVTLRSQMAGLIAFFWGIGITVSYYLPWLEGWS